MSVRRSQVLVTTVATALAGGMLVATTTAPASAAPATTTYLCYFDDLEDVEVPVTMDVTNLPAALPIGAPVPAGAWDVSANVRFDELTTAYLLTQTDDVMLASEDSELLLDDRSILVPLASGVETLPLAQALDVPMTGTNDEFTPKAAGDLALELPAYFTLDISDGEGELIFSVDCEVDEDELGVIGTVAVEKQSSSMTRKLLAKPVKVSKRAKVLVTVASETGDSAVGQVMAAIGGRNLVVGDLNDGRVTLKLPKLPIGKHKVTLSYLGSKYVDKATRNVTVKVVGP